MRRAVARGRVYPQSYSTDRRYGRLSLKACALFPLMWVNADDQGRLPGDHEEIKYAACPNIDHITKADIPGLLEELAKNDLIVVYKTSNTVAIQILDWWDVHRPQWAWPSQYPPPEGWQDHLRYKEGAKIVVTKNWFSQVSGNNVSGEQYSPSQASETNVSGEQYSPSQVSETNVSGEQHLPSQVSNNIGSGETGFKRERSKEKKETEKERGKRKPKEEEGNSPEHSGEKPSPSLTGLSTDELEILHRLTECFKKEWGRVPAARPYEVIPREPNARESAQLRDLGEEISAAGGCPLDYIDQAFREAAGQVKFSVSYVRAILLDWLGVARGPA